MKWFTKCLVQYADFKGRARRKEYWMFTLFYCLFYFVVVVIDAAFGVYDDESGWGILSGIFWLGTLIPSLAVSVRRLHDVGKSGWFLLFWLIPIAGWIILFVWSVTKGEEGGNAWGDDPKTESV